VPLLDICLQLRVIRRVRMSVVCHVVFLVFDDLTGSMTHPVLQSDLLQTIGSDGSLDSLLALDQLALMSDGDQVRRELTIRLPQIAH